MTGKISQEYVDGQEYTVDILCDLGGTPVYVVPRLRLRVESGISVAGQVARDHEIEEHCRTICRSLRLRGPINVQCIRSGDGLFFTEVNARMSGGLALSMAATENWFSTIKAMLSGRTATSVPIRSGLTMIRHHADVFVQGGDLRRAL